MILVDTFSYSTIQDTIIIFPNIKRNCIISTYVISSNALVFIQNNSCASTFLCPVATVTREFIVEIISPSDSSQKSHKSNKCKDANEDNKDRVQDPQNSFQACLLFILSFLFLLHQDFCCFTHISICSYAILSVCKPQVKATPYPTDDGQPEANKGEIVNSCQDQLSNRNN